MQMGKHSAAVAHLCPWRRWLALVVATITSGTWIPFVTIDVEPTSHEDEQSVSVPEPVHEAHPAPHWPVPEHHKPKPKHETPPLHKPTEHRPQQTHHPKPVTRPVHAVADKDSSKLVSFLRAQIGKPYVWGGNGPNVYDCSGLTKAAYARVGIRLPRVAADQSVVGRQVSLSHLEVGDLLFWGGVGTAFHVGIYVGNGKYIAAQNPHEGVVELHVSAYRPNFARRIL